MTELQKKLFRLSMELLPVPRDMTGSINGKEYKYSSLNAIRTALSQPLKDNQIAYRFGIHSDSADLVTLPLFIVDTDTDETLEFHMTIPVIQAANENIFHTVGMGLTFHKKNMLSTIFNLNVADDVDANVKQVKKIIAKSHDVPKIIELLDGGASDSDIQKAYVVSEKIQNEIQKVRYGS